MGISIRPPTVNKVLGIEVQGPDRPTSLEASTLELCYKGEDIESINADELRITVIHSKPEHVGTSIKKSVWLDRWTRTEDTLRMFETFMISRALETATR